MGVAGTRALCLIAALGLSSCAVDQADLSRWETTLGGPERLSAVVTHAKYPHALRVQAAQSLVRMKPRRGHRVGIHVLVEDTLAKMGAPERDTIVRDLVPLIIAQLGREPPKSEPGQPLPIDPSFPYKDASYLLLTWKKPQMIADEKSRAALEEALARWAMTDFHRRLNDRDQAYGMEQLLGAIGPSAAQGLPDQLRRDGRNSSKIASMIARLGDEATKERGGKRLADIAVHTGSAEWRKSHADELRGANERAGFEPTAEEFDAQMNDYQEEAVTRVLGSMKVVGGRAVLDYALTVGGDDKQPVKRRRAALAALEKRIKADDQASIERLLALTKADAPAEVLDQALRRLRELPREKVEAHLVSLFETDKWLVRRAAAGTLLAVSEAKHIDAFLAALDGHAKKNFNLPETITYGARLGLLKGGEPRKALERYLERSKVRSRLSAFGFFFEHGTPEDVELLERYADDRQRIPKCEEDGDCDWSCLVGDEEKKDPKKISTVGDYIKYCVLPKVRRGANKSSKKEDAARDKRDNNE
jgi:hypothetical protein